MQIEIDVDGADAVIRRLERVTGNIKDLRPGFVSVADYLRGVFRSQFDSQGGSGSGGWAPLKPATLRRKQRTGMDPRILRMHDDLRKSFTNKGATDHIEKMTASELVIGSKDAKAKHHQHGAPRANIPQRKIIDLTERNKRQVVKRIQAHIFGQGGRG